MARQNQEGFILPIVIAVVVVAILAGILIFSISPLRQSVGQKLPLISEYAETCGSEFNDAYKNSAEKGEEPNFCFNLEKMNIEYKTNIKGHKYCTAFDGHNFRGSDWIDLNNKDLKQNFFHLDSQDFSSSYRSSTSPIGIGVCIESFSIYTGKDYCYMISNEQDRDRCLVFLAYYYNDISRCKKTSEPSMNDQANIYDTARYACYSNVAERSKNETYCDLIPKGVSMLSDSMNQNCHQFVKTRTVNK